MNVGAGETVTIDAFFVDAELTPALEDALRAHNRAAAERCDYNGKAGIVLPEKMPKREEWPSVE